MTHLFLLIIFSAVFTLILTVFGGWKHPRGANPRQGRAFLFLIFSVTMLAVGKWLLGGNPAHPHLTWVASLISGLILLVLLFALSLPGSKLDQRHQNTDEDAAPAHDLKKAGMAFQVSFWVLLAALILLAVF